MRRIAYVNFDGGRFREIIRQRLELPVPGGLRRSAGDGSVGGLLLPGAPQTALVTAV